MKKVKIIYWGICLIILLMSGKFVSAEGIKSFKVNNYNNTVNAHLSDEFDYCTPSQVMINGVKRISECSLSNTDDSDILKCNFDIAERKHSERILNEKTLLHLKLVTTKDNFKIEIVEDDNIGFGFVEFSNTTSASDVPTEDIALSYFKMEYFRIERRLNTLGHELTHVIQQRNTNNTPAKSTLIEIEVRCESITD